MSFLSPYYQQLNDRQVCFSARQASEFAKRVAGDFNPIHDPESSRFCVPGDLLFAVALQNYGVCNRMSFRFVGLVTDDSVIRYPDVGSSLAERKVDIVNQKNKPVLEVAMQGECCDHADQAEVLTKQYVAFSGQNFPQLLVPLMEEQNVMINPKRPLVIYESMSFELTELRFAALEIELGDTSLLVDGKRGTAEFNFLFLSQGQIIGKGTKTLLLSGMREYDAAVVKKLCDDYLENKANSPYS